MTARRPTHYDVLGVARDADLADIRRAYRERARALHPDTALGPDTVVGMSAVNEAWAVLRDPGRRRAYDAELDGRDAGAGAAPPPWFPSTGDDEVDEADDGGWMPTVAAKSGTTDLFFLLPAALFVGGLGCTMFGAMTFGERAVGLGITCVVLSGVLFLLAPLFVLVRQRRDTR